MSLVRVLIILFLSISSVYSNESPSIRYIDFDFLFNNSSMGKKITDTSNKEKEKLIKKSKKKESDLKKRKDDILTKKNILDPKEFEELVIQHQKNVEKFQVDVNNSLKEVNKKFIDQSRDLKKKIDTILLKYVSDNKIDIVLKKEAAVVSNSNFDITKEILELVNKD